MQKRRDKILKRIKKLENKKLKKKRLKKKLQKLKIKLHKNSPNVIKAINELFSKTLDEILPKTILNNFYEVIDIEKGFWC